MDYFVPNYPNKAEVLFDQENKSRDRIFSFLLDEIIFDLVLETINVEMWKKKKEKEVPKARIVHNMNLKDRKGLYKNLTEEATFACGNCFRLISSVKYTMHLTKCIKRRSIHRGNHENALKRKRPLDFEGSADEDGLLRYEFKKRKYSEGMDDIDPFDLEMLDSTFRMNKKEEGYDMLGEDISMLIKPDVPISRLEIYDHDGDDDIFKEFDADNFDVFHEDDVSDPTGIGMNLNGRTHRISLDDEGILKGSEIDVNLSDDDNFDFNDEMKFFGDTEENYFGPEGF